ncbi:hypothetical protein Zm00014a_039603 [Zea mays]|uniref:Uncharacterized protein n=1 Tax=Zea mays TaxID=4577 RepID=A0A3L6FFV9_MAIZE|nr:hypothetical protein Zm00014a_039603 [Zea mays]
MTRISPMCFEKSLYHIG